MSWLLVSGGQTGADQAALDVAIARHLPHGGWCPKGRISEAGVIPPRYQLNETPSADYLQRTEWNVRDSDATVIFTIAPALSGGSKATADFAAAHQKPWLHISQDRDAAASVEKLVRFLADHHLKTLNVAGSRESEEPSIRNFVQKVLSDILA
ncbi:MAG: dihydroneopterin aldolase [Pedosphaera sp.]|nr:dihydroneopterin aldolase [Pedosphaera sp.]